MSFFALNLLLAACWAFFSGALSLTNLVVGFALGYLALVLISPLLGTGSRYPWRLLMWGRLMVMFLYELVVSSLSVAWEVIRPRPAARPAVVDMPLDLKTDGGIFLVSNLITLTPGTLSLSVNADKTVLQVHAMFADDPDQIVRELKNGMEKWVREAVE